MSTGARGRSRGWCRAGLCAVATLVGACQSAPASSSGSSTLPSAAPPSSASPGTTAPAGTVPAGVFARTLEDIPFRISLPAGWQLGTADQEAIYWTWLGEQLPALRSTLEAQAAFSAGGALIAYDGTEIDARDPSLFCTAITRGPTSPSDALDQAEASNLEGIRAAPRLAGDPAADRITLPAGPAVRIRWRESAPGGDVTSVGYVVVVGPHAVTCVFRSRTDEVAGREATWEQVVQSIAPASAWSVTATIEVGVKPFEIAAGGGSIWVANADSSEISRIEPATNVATTFDVDAGPAGNTGVWDIAFDRERVWATVILVDEDGASLVGNLIVVDPATGSIDRTVAVGRTPFGLAIGFGSAWVANLEDATISRVDQATFEVTTFDVPAGPMTLVAAPDAIWVAHTTGKVSRIDPATNESRTFDVAPVLQALVLGSRGIWASGEDAVYLIDPDSGEVLASVKVSGAAGLAARDGTVWAVESTGVFLREIDEATATIVDSVQLDTTSWGLLELDGTLWVVWPAAPDRKFAESAPGLVTRLDR